WIGADGGDKVFPQCRTVPAEGHLGAGNDRRGNGKAVPSHRGGEHAHIPTCRRIGVCRGSRQLASGPPPLIRWRGGAQGVWIEGRDAAGRLSSLLVAQRPKALPPVRWSVAGIRL